MKPAKNCWHSQVTFCRVLNQMEYFLFEAFNEMDENHDGQVSEEEFIEVTEISQYLDLSPLLVVTGRPV